jgi:hypothetical protein
MKPVHPAADLPRITTWAVLPSHRDPVAPCRIKSHKLVRRGGGSTGQLMVDRRMERADGTWGVPVCTNRFVAKR